MRAELPTCDEILAAMREEVAHLPPARPIEAPPITVAPFLKKIQQEPVSPATVRGRVTRITGMVVRARIPNARIGELCTIEAHGRPPVRAEVVGFDEDEVFLTPLDPLDEVGPKTPVVNRGKSLGIGVGDALLGRVVNSFGEPIDDRGDLVTHITYPIRAVAPEAMKRRRITEMLPIGIRAIDLLLSVGEGQRLGVFSTAGVGKSSLLGMVARNSTADVNVVALIGERGREVRDFVEENLGPEGLAKSVVIVSTSDEPAMRRILAAYAATAVAEYFRDQGKRVMLLMDSVTRFARALREVALSVGEPPARQGYPPSVFAALPELLERVGNTDKGSITAFYTILLSSEQMEDPLGEEIRAILDGHIYLSSRLAHVEHFPAIDVLASNSRVMMNIIDDEHKGIAEKLRRLWATYETNRDLISIGAYRSGTDPEIDEAVRKRSAVVDFLVQRHHTAASLEEALDRARQVIQS